MRTLRSFIAEQSKQPLKDVVKSLKEEFDYDGTTINQIQLALYLFTEAVNAVLRLHSIKPHWMFALDNLMRTAVQAAIMVLSPDLGENLAASSLADRKMSKWDRQDSDSTAYNLGSLGVPYRISFYLVEITRRYPQISLFWKVSSFWTIVKCYRFGLRGKSGISFQKGVL
jgi:hypothetical protein